MNKLPLLLTSFTLLIALQLSAQPFENISSGITGLGRSIVAWGDYDNDGDLDIAICGVTNAGDHLTKIYRNDEGAFTEINAGIKGVKDGSLEWGDYDNDDDLDLLVTGQTMDEGNISLIYNNSDSIFVEYDAGFPGVSYGQGTWGDYDNDGDLDVLITGNWHVELYDNKNGVFELAEQDFGNLQSSRASWGDFDNDGDLDLLLIGDTGGGYFTQVYINDYGTFSSANLDMEGLFSGTCDWVDFDKDGDMDISVSGYDIFLEPRFLIYVNQGDGTITPYIYFLTGLGTGSVDWGDYDNDGDLDILACGKNASCGGGISNIYYFQNGMFISEPEANIDGAIRCSAAWADYDNDGDLDFLLTGMTPSEVPFTKMFRNAAGDNNYSVNTEPAASSTLQSSVDGSSVMLSWEKATDDQTPQDGLNYNLRVGTAPGENDVLTSMANAETGYRFIQALGNTNAEISRMLTGLVDGTYYWSVQTIDQAYCGSVFAEEQSFTILATGLDEMNAPGFARIYPNPAREKIYIETASTNPVEYSIFNMNGQEVIRGSAVTGDVIDISILLEGVYFIHIQSGKDTAIKRLLKQ